MNPTPLSELAAMPEGAPVLLAIARVTRVSKLSSGENWSLQFLTLSQDGREYQCVVKNHDEIPNTFAGKDIEFRSSHGQRGFSGVYTKDWEDRKANAKVRVLYCTGTALISPAKPADPTMFDEKPKEPKAEPPPEQPKQTGPQVTPEERYANFLGRESNAYFLCAKAAHCLIDRLSLENIQATPEWTERIATTLYIQSGRLASDMIGNLPSLPIQKTSIVFIQDQVDKVCREKGIDGFKLALIAQENEIDLNNLTDEAALRLLKAVTNYGAPL